MAEAARNHILSVYMIGARADTLRVENFNGTEIEAANRLSTIWDKLTPVDGTGWRATRRRAGERHIAESIGW